MEPANAASIGSGSTVSGIDERSERLDGPAGLSMVPSADDLNLEVLLGFQETMRQFLATQERVLQQFLHTANGRRPVAAASLPLIRQAPQSCAEGGFVLTQRLTLESDPYLADHVIDARPVLPMAMALEYVAQFAAACLPGWHAVEIRDLRLMAGVVIPDADGCEVVLRGRPIASAEAGFQSIFVELTDRRRSLGPNYRATVRLSAHSPAPATPRLSRPAGVSISGADTYTKFLFHGPRFRCVQQVCALGESGVSSMLAPSVPASFLGSRARAASAWLFDPAAVDAALQMAWVWSYMHHGGAALPTRMATVRRHGVSPVTAPLCLVQQISLSGTGDTVCYDAEFVDAQGHVRYTISAGESTKSEMLNRLVPVSPDFAREAGAGSN